MLLSILSQLTALSAPIERVSSDWKKSFSTNLYYLGLISIVTYLWYCLFTNIIIFDWLCISTVLTLLPGFCTTEISSRFPKTTKILSEIYHPTLTDSGLLQVDSVWSSDTAFLYPDTPDVYEDLWLARLILQQMKLWSTSQDILCILKIANNITKHWSHEHKAHK